MGTERVISVERVIPAPAQRIFDVLADPRRHGEIDGSGTVRDADVDGPQRLSLGARFGMNMKMGIKYRMVNEVVDFEDDRRIAWAPMPEFRGKVKENLGGRIWRYELEPVEGGTRVRETWDATKEGHWLMHRLLRTGTKVTTSMEKTLSRLAEVTTAG